MSDLSPEAPLGGAVGTFTGLPDSSGDTQPQAEALPFSGLPDSSGDTMPPAPQITGEMPMNLGRTRQAL